MERMFYNCTNFNQQLNSWNTSNVRHMDNMFYNCPISLANVQQMLMRNVAVASVEIVNPPPIFVTTSPTLLEMENNDITEAIPVHNEIPVAIPVHNEIPVAEIAGIADETDRRVEPVGVHVNDDIYRIPQTKIGGKSRRIHKKLKSKQLKRNSRKNKPKLKNIIMF
jgi:surface protein